MCDRGAGTGTKSLVHCLNILSQLFWTHIVSKFIKIISPFLARYYVVVMYCNLYSVGIKYGPLYMPGVTQKYLFFMCTLNHSALQQLNGLTTAVASS